MVDQPWIKEIDINPLLASPDRLLALDARMVLHDPGTDEAALPKSAIRAYPTQYAAPWKMKNKQRVQHPPDPARRRALDGQVPRNPLRAERLQPLFQRPQAVPTDGPRTPDANLFQ